MHVQLCIQKIYFFLVAEPTQKSDSKAIHKFSKFITGISFYYLQQVINTQRQRGYIINTKVFITQQITSNEMNFNSTNPRRWKRLLWTTSDSLGRAIYCRSRDQHKTNHPGWSGLLYQYQGREPPKCPRYRHSCSHKCVNNSWIAFHHHRIVLSKEERVFSKTINSVPGRRCWS